MKRENAEGNNYRCAIAKICTYFRGIFMRTTLSIEGVRQNENGIVNLDNA